MARMQEGLLLLSSYHVHSTFSDGDTDIASLVKGAGTLGLDELGISDHYVVLPAGAPCTWSMNLADLDIYLTSIEDASRLAKPGLKVLKGLEADYLPETIDTLKDLISGCELDYLIGSVHFVGDFCVD